MNENDRGVIKVAIMKRFEAHGYEDRVAIRAIVIPNRRTVISSVVSLKEGNFNSQFQAHYHEYKGGPSFSRIGLLSR